MTKPINLNKARKAKARAAKEQTAAQNRVKFGRTKAEQLRDKLDAARASKIVDDSQRDP